MENVSVGQIVDYSFTNAAGRFVIHPATIEKVYAEGCVDLRVDMDDGDKHDSDTMLVTKVYFNAEPNPRERTFKLVPAV